MVIKMKTPQILGLAFAAVFSVHAAADRHIIYDYGTVIDTVPVVKTIRVSSPREECWEEDVQRRDRYRNDGVSTVIGAIVGGAIGNAVGHSNKNKKVGAVVGAVLGGTVGHAVGSRKQGYANYRDTEEVCRVYQDYHEEDRVVGYKVRYRYNNETYSTRTDVDPGDTIKLRLALSPVI